MEASNRDAKTAGPVATRMREMIMPHVFNRFYEHATGWLYDFDRARSRPSAEADDTPLSRASRRPQHR